MRDGKPFPRPSFHDNRVSTKTLTVATNLDIDLERLEIVAANLPITPYEVVVRSRGRQKKTPKADPNRNVPYGSFITVKFGDKLRGVETKCKCTEAGGSEDPEKMCSYCHSQWEKRENMEPMGFRNSFTVVIVLDKLVNFKVCTGGTFQMTGCKDDMHAEMCVKYLWSAIKDHPEWYSFRRGDCLQAYFVPAMRNIDLDLGFLIDREKLHAHTLRNSEWTSKFDRTLDYTGVNIKVPVQQAFTNMPLKRVILSEGEDWNEGEIVKAQEFFDLLTPAEQRRKLNKWKKKKHTFLVFQSGKLIVTGPCPAFMEDAYYEFLDFIQNSYDAVEERLTE
jgi:hypothetical protein